jgi:hypothetical protein
MFDAHRLRFAITIIIRFFPTEDERRCRTCSWCFHSVYRRIDLLLCTDVPLIQTPIYPRVLQKSNSSQINHLYFRFYVYSDLYPFDHIDLFF